MLHSTLCAYTRRELDMKLGKRLCAAAALLLSAVMLLWTGLPVAAYENTHNNTGKPSQDMLAAAES